MPNHYIKREREFENELSLCVMASKTAKLPRFLGENDVPTLAQHSPDFLPVKSTTSTFYRNARIGSKILKEYKEYAQRKLNNASMHKIDAQATMASTSIETTLLSDQNNYQTDRNMGQIPNKVNVGSAMTRLLPDLNVSVNERLLPKQNRSPGVLQSEKKYKVRCKEITELPVAKLKNELLGALRENQVLILVGETGSGKTTQLPQYLFHEGYFENGMIGVTQPRRSACVSIARRVSEEIGCELGTLVGYSIRFEDITGSQTKIRYMTDGVLCRELCSGSSAMYLAKYSCIILDEVHERSLDTDLLCGYMHEVLRVRKDFRLIITSATIQVQRFKDFFPSSYIFSVPGRNFEVEKIYSPLPVEDYVEQAVSLAVDIHNTKEIPGDMLIFMTGRSDVLATIELIRTKLAQFFPDSEDSLILVPVYSMLSSTEQSRIFVRAPQGKRKCIVSTNIAETSLTIDGIKYVIDTGYVKMKVFRPSLGMNLIDIFPISQAQAVQRAGRAGRTSDGICFRLYTKEQYEDEMLQASVPEIQRTSLSRVVLHIRSLGIHNVASFRFLTPPSESALSQAIKELWMLGALNDENKLSRSGRLMLEFPTDLVLSSFMIDSAELGCSEEAISIVALLCVEYRKIIDFSRKQSEKNLNLEKFYFCGSDHLTLLNIYEHYHRNPLSEEWASSNNIGKKVFLEAEKIRIQLHEIFVKLKFPLNSCGSNFHIVKRALARSHFMKSARMNGVFEYVPILQYRTPVKLQSASTVIMSHSADYVIYHDIVGIGGDREYLSVVTEVDPQWVLEKKPQLFHVFDAHHKEVMPESRDLLRSGGIENECASLSDNCHFSGEIQEEKKPEAEGIVRKVRNSKSKKGKVSIQYSGSV